MACSGTNQVRAQLDLIKYWKETKAHKNVVYLLPKELDERVTSLHLPDMGSDSNSPLIFKAGVSADPNAYVLALKNESFAPILVEVPIETEATCTSCLPAAVDFAHNECWGSLTCAILMDGYTKARNQEGLDRVFEGLKFGAVSINLPQPWPTSSRCSHGAAFRDTPRRTC